MSGGMARRSLAVEREQCIELHVVIMLTAVERVEVGDAVDAEHHDLAVDPHHGNLVAPMLLVVSVSPPL